MNLSKRLIVFLIIAFLGVGLYLGDIGVLNRFKAKWSSFHCRLTTSYELSNNDLYEFILSKKDEQKLKRQISFYRENKTLSNNFEEGSNYIKTKLFCKGDTIKIKLKIKGRSADNYREEDYFSLKIKYKKGGESFSIYPIATRSYLNEWYINEVFKLEELPYNKLEIIDVSIIGKKFIAFKVSKKSYTGEGVIDNYIRYDNDLNWKLSSLNNRWFDSQNLNLLNLKYFGKWEGYEKVKFNNGLNKIIGDFDTDEVVKTLALTLLFQNYQPAHGVQLHNIRFFKKNDGRLSIINNDQNFIGLVKHKSVSDLMEDPFFRPFFRNESFISSFKKYIEYYSNENVISSWIDSLEAKLKENVKIVKNQFPCYDFSPNILTQNSKSLKELSIERIDTIDVYGEDFILNLGGVPQIVRLNDSSFILYPNNKVGFTSSFKID